MASFDDAIAVRQIAENRWAGDIPEGWRIGAVPNGGLVLALAGSVLRQALPHPDPLTMHILYLAPTELGPVECEVEILRCGGSTSFATLSLFQHDEIKVQVSASFSELERLSGENWSTLERPQCTPIEEIAVTGEHGIELRRSVDMHYASGGEVFKRGEPDGSGCFNGYMKFSDGRDPDVLSLLLFADAMAPPVFTVFGALHWVPTVDLSVQIRRHPAPGPIQACFRSRHMSAGIVEEDGELWDSQGNLVALSRGTSKVRIQKRYDETSG